jgi:hypothetical protein
MLSISGVVILLFPHGERDLYWREIKKTSGLG